MVNIGTSVIPVSQYLNYWTTVGASGAIYGLLLAFGMMFPNERMFIIPIPVPIKAKWVIVGSIAVEFFSGIGTNSDGVAHMAHLGGMVFGILLILYWRRQARRTYYGDGGSRMFGNMQQRWKTYQNKRNTNQHYTTGNPDWDYNANKRATQEEVDRILDKIKKSGYDSLTKSEKQTLFEQSRHDR